MMLKSGFIRYTLSKILISGSLKNYTVDFKSFLSDFGNIPKMELLQLKGRTVLSKYQVSGREGEKAFGDITVLYYSSSYLHIVTLLGTLLNTASTEIL